MIQITGTARVEDKNRDAFLEVTKTFLTAASKEKGCISCKVAEDICEPGTFLFTEIWTDLAAVDTHFAQDHSQTFMLEAKKLSPLPPDFRIQRLEKIER